MKLYTVTLLLGSNLGDRLQLLSVAREEIEKVIGLIIKQSKVYETASWGNEKMAPFLNMVVDAETALTPRQVMQNILQIEELLGRKRSQKWESRTIDIDILFFEDQVIESADLTVPHPFLHKRRFTLVPLVEIHALKVHPVLKMTCDAILKEVSDNLKVTEYLSSLAQK